MKSTQEEPGANGPGNKSLLEEDMDEMFMTPPDDQEDDQEDKEEIEEKEEDD